MPNEVNVQLAAMKQNSKGGRKQGKGNVQKVYPRTARNREDGDGRYYHDPCGGDDNGIVVQGIIRLVWMIAFGAFLRDNK